MTFFKKSTQIKILFVTSEEAPFAKVGGLGEVMYSLPRSLRALGHDVRVLMPRYGTIDPNTWHLKMAFDGLHVPSSLADNARHIQSNLLFYE